VVQSKQTNSECQKKEKFMLFKGKSEQINLEGLQLNIGDQLIDQVGTDCKEQYLNLLDMYWMINLNELAMLSIFVKKLCLLLEMHKTQLCRQPSV
jgi:hypothetical protein